MKTTLLFIIVITLTITGCGTSSLNCKVKSWHASSEFLPKVANTSGDQVLFTFSFQTECTSLDMDRLSESIFEEYAKKHGYPGFRVAEKLPVKIAFTRRCVVVFNHNR